MLSRRVAVDCSEFGCNCGSRRGAPHRRRSLGHKMSDDEAHHQAVQEIANRQRSAIAPFGVPPTGVTLPEPGPATESVPYTPDMQPQFEQLRRPLRTAASLEQ